MTIWRYDALVQDDMVIQAPEGAEWIAVEPAPAWTGRAYSTPLTLWAIVDTDAETVEHTLHVRGTGHELGDVGRHIGTVVDGQMVWHVFESAPVGGEPA